MIAALTLLLTILILGIPAAIVFIPWTLITRQCDGAVQRVAQDRAAGVPAGARFASMSPGWSACREDRACIFMSNHVSNLDPPALFPRIPGRTSAFLKRSLMKIPVLGYGMKLADFVPVDRDGRVESAIESVAVARAGARERHPHHHVRRRHAIARRAHAAVQERAVLPGHGGRRAVRSGIHPRHREDDGQGQHARAARHGVHHVSRAARSGGIFQLARI